MIAEQRQRPTMPAALAALAATVVIVCVVAAIWLRLAPMVVDFPLGDGGLFWVMANDLRDNAFVPPPLTTYNAGDIPWMYPPIGLYLAAIAGGGLEWFRILPALFAVATIPAFWLLARALTNDRAAIAATIAYGLTAQSYLGLIAGGGMTRGPGVLLALLTMWAVVRERVVLAGVLGGLVILAHPTAALYGGLGAALLWLTHGAPRRMLFAPMISLAIGALWFVPMVVRHGAGALVGSLGSRGTDLVDNATVILAGVLNPPNVAFSIGLVGLVVAIPRRRGDLIGLLLVSAVGASVVDRWAVIPLAILAGLAVDAAITELPRMRSVALLAVAVVVAVMGVVLSDRLEPLTSGEQELMAWAGAETPPDATFAVIGYPPDLGMVEWFPAISGRENVTAWQGTEWVAGGYRREEATSASECRALACLPEADYYVLRPACCPELVAGLTPVRADVYVRDGP